MTMIKDTKSNREYQLRTLDTARWAREQVKRQIGGTQGVQQTWSTSYDHKWSKQHNCNVLLSMPAQLHHNRAQRELFLSLLSTFRFSSFITTGHKEGYCPWPAFLSSASNILSRIPRPRNAMQQFVCLSTPHPEQHRESTNPTQHKMHNIAPAPFVQDYPLTTPPLFAPIPHTQLRPASCFHCLLSQFTERAVSWKTATLFFHESIMKEDEKRGKKAVSPPTKSCMREWGKHNLLHERFVMLTMIDHIGSFV